MNRTLVALVSSLVTVAAASHEMARTFIAKLLDVSLECLSTIEKQLSNDLIRSACGSSFGDIHLIAIIVVAGGVFVVIQFWRDIGQWLVDKAGE